VHVSLLSSGWPRPRAVCAVAGVSDLWHGCVPRDELRAVMEPAEQRTGNPVCAVGEPLTGAAVTLG
jgi:hypothetical protein